MLKTALYRHFAADGTLLYVGVSLNAVVRLSQHAEHAHWFASIDRVSIEWFANRQAALDAERAAILKENPAHNVRRPTPKENKELYSDRQDSRFRNLRRVVEFNPLYSFQEVAKILGCSPSHVRRLIDAGELGSVPSPSGNRKMVSGWQLIDYIEYLEATGSVGKRAAG